jgi:hypothetical protein
LWLQVKQGNQDRKKKEVRKSKINHLRSGTGMPRSSAEPSDGHAMAQEIPRKGAALSASCAMAQERPRKGADLSDLCAVAQLTRAVAQKRYQAKDLIHIAAPWRSEYGAMAQPRILNPPSVLFIFFFLTTKP